MSKETITIEVPLDDPHRAVYEELTNAGIPVEGALAEMVRRPVEDSMHAILQQEKYHDA